MRKPTAQMLIVFLLALSLVTPNTGSPPLAVQDRTPPTDARPSDLADKLAKIEKQVEEKRKELAIPGVALAIVKDDKVILQEGFGLRDVERNLPVTAETIFAIGSCTKAFTAMAAVMSQDDGKLSIEDSPKKHLPYFRLQDPDADAMITVRDLLLHRSGLNLSDFVWYSGVLNRDEVIKLAGLAKPTVKPREKFQYQNIAYTAAGEVVAKANRTTWEKFVEQRIFKPLGMKSSVTSVGQMAKAKDHATGYSIDDKVTTKAELHDLFNVAPAGAIDSSIKDMSQWIRLMLGGGKFEGKRIVSETGFNDIVKKQIFVGDVSLPDAGYGLGWFLSERNGHPLLWHPGGIPGFNCLVQMVPDQNLGFVVLVNASSTPLLEGIRDIVLDAIVGKPETPAINAGSVAGGEPAKNVATAGRPSTSIDITLDELMAKVVAAAGGEANLRRHRSKTVTATLDLENQGLTGKTAIYAQEPNLSTHITTFTGLGKTIHSWREYFDGMQGGEESFGAKKYKGEQLESARISSDYYEELNWKTLYKSVTIGKSKVSDEEVYVVVKTPETSKAVIDYISAKSFLLVKRETGGSGEETFFSDYRNVDGEMVPFTSVMKDEYYGRVIMKVKEVKFNTRLPASTFRGAAK